MSSTFGIHIDRTDGEFSRRAKMTWQQVDHIRASYQRKPASMTQREFCEDWASLFGVTWQCVAGIVNGQNWHRRIPA